MMANWLLPVLVLLGTVHASQWAVLVAGSNGFWNYRHQADVCHSYRLLTSQGVPADQIILLSFNDVANSSSNPFPGHLYNTHGTNPPDVAAGCVVDYQSFENNSTTFLAVLTGNDTAVRGLGSERVLKSTQEDTVFVYFVDHGAPGLVAFPNDILYADELMAALEEMTQKKMFKEMVIFLEACYGGSMFDGILPTDTGIYAITAANDTESSWGMYCPIDEDIVNGQKLYTCLGDMFSAYWMDVESTIDPSTTSLSQLYTSVAALTNLSHVMEYGDMSVASAVVGVFLGMQAAADPSPHETSDASSWWMGYDAKYQYLAYKYLIEPTTSNAEELVAEVTDRATVTSIFDQLMGTISPEDPTHLEDVQLPVTDFDCLRSAINAYISHCRPMTEFTLRFVNILKNACEEGSDPISFAQNFQEICANTENRPKKPLEMADFPEYMRKYAKTVKDWSSFLTN